MPQLTTSCHFRESRTTHVGLARVPHVALTVAENTQVLSFFPSLYMSRSMSSPRHCRIIKAPGWKDLQDNIREQWGVSDLYIFCAP